MELRYLEDFEVIKAIIHMVDKDHPRPLFSESLIETEGAREEFISVHINRAFKSADNTKAEFAELLYSEEENASVNIKSIIGDMVADSSDTNFIEKSKLIASMLQGSVRGLEAVGAFDVVIALLKSGENKLVAIMKLDYKRGFIRDLTYNEDAIKIDIIEQETGLPAKSQKLSNCAVIKPDNADGYDMMVMNKTVRDEEGNVVDFFLDRFLKAETVMDDTSKTVRFRAIMESWLRRSVKDDIEKAIEAREVVSGALGNGLTVDVADIIYKVTDSNDEKEALEDRLVAVGITPNDTFQIDKGFIEKKLSSKKIKTDSGFVLKADRELFMDRNRFEIIHNGDGTVNYILKNIKNIFEY